MDKTMMGAPMVQTMVGNNNMIGHNMDRNISGSTLVFGFPGNNMDNTMMGGPMVQTMLGHNNMLGHNMDRNIRDSTLVFGFPGMGHRTYTNMMGRDMASNMVGQDIPSHTMGSQDMYTNANLMGRDMNRMEPLNTMSHKMQIETMPSQSFTRFF